MSAPKLDDMDALEVTVTDAELAEWCTRRGVKVTTREAILCAHSKVLRAFGLMKGTLGTQWLAAAMDDPLMQTWLVKFTRNTPSHRLKKPGS